MEERIAKIKSTRLGYEDHGIFTAILDLDYGGSGQGAGMYALDGWDEEREARFGIGEGIDFIAGVLGACGVDTWEKLPGRTVIAICEDGFGLVRGLKPLPTEGGKEFMFGDAFPAREPA